ncbi:protein disulfide oxidoreductase [Thiorhodococcus mannitoliphagus]|uniref:Protein disulfide oxidoreductase n=1 Tax=Thiorhodococcus mannitoliphagus TaxID=329406 RepID=A0A6P1DTI5_9GAMM|nr:protein disulfide oxidoreductase [Thiorhodococcus mannitoliphagus]NEX19025.1 protein disulfide oxidoreductase [Thiorhodococcus mannitoliphagus]
MTDPAKPSSKPPVSRWRGWAFNVALIVLIFGGVQWWKARPLASGEAPLLAGVTIEGTPLDLRDYRGQTVMVHFWASWCPVCRVMDGAVEAISKDHPVISVALQSGGPGELRDFMHTSGLSFPVLPDANGEISSRWGVAGVPTTFVVDAAGQIRQATVGASSGPGLRARLWMASQAE